MDELTRESFRRRAGITEVRMPNQVRQKHDDTKMGYDHEDALRKNEYADHLEHMIDDILDNLTTQRAGNVEVDQSNGRFRVFIRMGWNPEHVNTYAAIDLTYNGDTLIRFPSYDFTDIIDIIRQRYLSHGWSIAFTHEGITMEHAQESRAE